MESRNTHWPGALVSTSGAIIRRQLVAVRRAEGSGSFSKVKRIGMVWVPKPARDRIASRRTNEFVDLRQFASAGIASFGSAFMRPRALIAALTNCSLVAVVHWARRGTAW